MSHLASAQYWDWPAGGDTGRLFLVGRSAPTGLAIVHWIGCINTIKAIFILTIVLRKYRCHLCNCSLNIDFERHTED